MKRYFILLIFVISIPVLAKDNVIKITAEQVSNLGIATGKLQVVSQFPLHSAPAQVVIPPDQEYIVSATQAGLVSKLTVAVGDSVIKNQLLAELTSPALLSLQRQYLKADNARQLAEYSLQRDKQLVQEGVISKRRWQESQSHYNSFVAEANEARQLLEIAGLSSVELKKLVKHHQLTSQLNVVSPIDGVVIERMVVSGERVDVMMPLYRIASLQPLWLDIAIPQQHINQVRLNDKVTVQGMNVTARLFLFAKNVNVANQTILARAKIERGFDVIRPGQTVNVLISQHNDKPLFKVANSALAQSQGISYVFVRNEVGFLAVPVQVLGRELQESIIAGDIQTSSEVAVKGAVALKASLLGLGGDE